VGIVRKKHEMKQKIEYKPVGLKNDTKMAFDSIIIYMAQACGTYHCAL
jgi:hypothetical protein